MGEDDDLGWPNKAMPHNQRPTASSTEGAPGLTADREREEEGEEEGEGVMDCLMTDVAA